jgi:ankyrin repeat protein
LNAALLIAAHGGNVEIFRRLLDAGADIGALRDSGESVLMMAATSGSPEMVREVLKRHVDVNFVSHPDPRPCTEETKNNNGCREFDEDAGRTALMEAVSQIDNDNPPEGVDRVEVLRLLLAAGADVDARDKAGNTALILCTSAEKARVLLEAGADPNARNHKGQTAMSRPYSDEMKALLIKHGAVQEAAAEEDK